jgi:hypothetical protein
VPAVKTTILPGTTAARAVATLAAFEDELPLPVPLGLTYTVLDGCQAQSV